VATASNLQSIQDSLRTYERSSGALLNSSKSFLITKQCIPNSTFPSSPIPRRYLGFYLNSRGRFILPPHLIDDGIEALQRIKRLPLSLAGRMTVLSSYIRPRLLYRLGITSTKGISSYLMVEKWFLFSSREYIPGSAPSSVFSDKKLSHPTFHFRLRPFPLSLNLYRLSIFLRTTPLRLSLTNTTTKQWLPRCLHSNVPQSLPPYPWNFPASSIRTLISLIPEASIRVDQSESETERQVHPTNQHSPSPSTWVTGIHKKLQSESLPLSSAQQRMFSAFNTDPERLFHIIHKLHLSSALVSFTWRLLHKRLYLHLHDSCPFCLSAPPSTSHLFSGCPLIAATIKQPLIPQPLRNILTLPHHHSTVLHAVICAWSIWKVFNVCCHKGRIPNDAISSVLLQVYQDELNRVKLADSVTM